MQAKEIARLNAVYNKLLKDAGVELFGEQYIYVGCLDPIESCV